MTDGARRLYLVRHGSTPCNEARVICGRRDVELSELGRRQALAAAGALAGRRVDLVLASPLRRTFETARAVATPHGVEPEADDGLLELRLEGWAGRSRAELSASDPVWQAWLRAPDRVATPEGETLAEVQRRAREALDRGLARVGAGGGLVVVSHGGVLRVLLLGLLGMELASYHRLRTDPGSVSALELDEDGSLARLLALNLGEPASALR